MGGKLTKSKRRANLKPTAAAPAVTKHEGTGIARYQTNVAALPNRHLEVPRALARATRYPNQQRSSASNVRWTNSATNGATAAAITCTKRAAPCGATTCQIAACSSIYPGNSRAEVVSA